MVTDDPAIAADVRMLRNHGSEDKTIHERVGYTSRLDELQAAGLSVLLKTFPEHVEERKWHGHRFRKLFPSAQVPTDGADPCWNLYVRTEANRQIGPRERVYYDPPLHLQPAFAPYRSGSLPTTEALSKLLVATPF